MIEVVEQHLYRLLLRPFLLLARLAQLLQSGRLDAHLAYMLIALIAALAVVTARHCGRWVAINTLFSTTLVNVTAGRARG